ncbi:hypothetical protein D6810_02740 [Candidatus Dojkabacteria bacterium]|uniref:Type 4a pilus biogenesis protein PilO n=1 Tax=Candidatus Dojkabacteria bacterium TaxID=2099670 RepID=A0A3M0YXS7_9BACT|nr:MAG: hypothetical protein D6810_02740 [Candidatus Dojkabacteria bacterium]
MDDLQKSKKQRLLEEILSSKEKSSYFIIAVTVIFTISVLFFGVLPSYSAFSAQAVENQKREDLLNQAKDKLDKLKLLSQELNSETQLVDKLYKVLPNNMDQDAVIDEILKLVQKNYLELKSINFTENEDIPRKHSNLMNDQKLKVVGVNLLVESSNSNFTSLISLIRDIERSKRFFDVVELTFSRSNRGSEVVVYQLNLKVNYYFYED